MSRDDADAKRLIRLGPLRTRTPAPGVIVLTACMARFTIVERILYRHGNDGKGAFIVEPKQNYGRRPWRTSAQPRRRRIWKGPASGRSV